MDVLHAIKIRRSVRQYRPDSIPPEVMDKLLDSLRLAPSACNFQPWKFILVTDQDTRNLIAMECNISREGRSRPREWIAGAPLVVVGCGFPEQCFQFMGGKGSSVQVDVTIALDHLTLCAASLGLGTCWIGAFDENKVKNLLCIPEKVKVVALTPVGYPADEKALHEPEPGRRKAAGEIIRWEKF